MSDKLKTKIKVKVKAGSPKDAIQGLKKAVAPLNWSKAPMVPDTDKDAQ